MPRRTGASLRPRSARFAPSLVYRRDACQGQRRSGLGRRFGATCSLRVSGVAALLPPRSVNLYSGPGAERDDELGACLQRLDEHVEVSADQRGGVGLLAP